VPPSHNPLHNNPLMIREGTGNLHAFFLRSSITHRRLIPEFPAMRAQRCAS